MPEEIQFIKKTVEEFNKKTCVQWVDIRETPLDVKQYAVFHRSDAWCRKMRQLRNDTSGVTYILLTLGAPCLPHKIEHMMMHAMGFTHEHQRSDRDCYVDVKEFLRKNLEYIFF